MKIFALLLLPLAVPASAADYAVITRTADVAETPDKVWAAIGDYCFISKLFDVPCEYVAGTGGLGTVRRLRGTTVEPMIARTSHSYTYGQIEGGMKDFDYHGTLAVEPAGKGSRVVYSLVYDQSKMASDAVRASERLRMETRFQGAVDRAKAIVEAAR